MWETTFARNSHAGLGEDFTKILPSSPACYVRKLAYPIPAWLFLANVVSHMGRASCVVDRRMDVGAMVEQQANDREVGVGVHCAHEGVVRRPSRVTMDSSTSGFRSTDLLHAS
jgi:hypothetical protein